MIICTSKLKTKKWRNETKFVFVIVKGMMVAMVTREQFLWKQYLRSVSNPCLDEQYQFKIFRNKPYSLPVQGN